MNEFEKCSSCGKEEPPYVCTNCDTLYCRNCRNGGRCECENDFTIVRIDSLEEHEEVDLFGIF